MSQKKYHAAIDLGASSGRVVVGFLDSGNIRLKEIHRFDNTQVKIDGHHCWNLTNLKDNIIKGLAKCKEAECIPSTIGIDTWGVDFVLLDENDNILGNCVAYRDDRTDGMYDVADSLISSEKVYENTGIQKLQFNTIYQLLAVKQQDPSQLAYAKQFLMVPDYLNFVLTGIKANEYTNATTTSLINAKTCDWDKEIFDACNFPKEIFSKPTMAGTVLGPLSKHIAEKVGYEADVVLPATHDTGSAFLAVPAKNEQSVFLSSGTWSLLGVENKVPYTDEICRKQNMTNEGGFEKRYRFLKNIMGLWLIQSVRRELNGVKYVEDSDDEDLDNNIDNVLSEEEQQYIQSLQKPDKTEYSFAELSNLAKDESGYSVKFDVNDSRFLTPKSMIIEIKNAIAESGQQVPKNIGQLMQCIYLNLAECYKDAIAAISENTGVNYTDLNIVGGGCQDRYLNQTTADVCGVNVWAGPIEATSIGNIVVQMISSKEFENIEQARKIIAESFDVEVFKPV